MTHRSHHTCTWSALAAFVLTLVPIVATAAPPHVKVESGLLEGVTADGVVSFKGIPFAAPPIGDLRWRPPQPSAPWTGVRKADAYGHDCMQLPFPGDAAPLGTPPAEDCLVLNVWAPAQPSAQRLPVMVWIYGGGFVNGGSSPAVYDGSSFARRGVVLVSFNYRVGRFGFFAHPALSRESPSGPLGNYAYMDQLAALRWVQKNIAAFGGDPGNVTVFGESAGGASVLMLLTSPAAKGLLHKAIIQSGTARDGVFPQRHLREATPDAPSAETVGLAFAKVNGIAGEDAAALSALRALPADKVVAGLNMATMMTPTYAGPMIDGTIVIETPETAIRNGRFAKVPVISGANSADIGFSFARTIDDVFAPFGADAEKARAVYDPQKTGTVRTVGQLVAMDRMMIEPARFVAQAFAASGQPAYHYRFSYVAESMRKEWPGAPHATEIPFVFDTVKARYQDKLAPADKAAAEAANAYWVAFAKSGNPNGQGRPQWPAVTAGQPDVILDFAAKGPVAGVDPWKARLDLVAGQHAKKSAAENDADRKEWIQLFNGKDLDGWTPKIAGYAPGENFGNTFRVQDGKLVVSYDQYTTPFADRFGHLFYKDTFSSYVIAVEYRFVGEQAKGGPGWAIRNSGVMLHGQRPETMPKDQDFPISIEAQLLGGDGKAERTTANLCTPGTNVVIGGKLFTTHCLNSKSNTYHGEQWVRAEFEVLGSERVTHYVEGEKVLEYEQPQIGGGNVINFDPVVKKDGQLLSEGTISLQSESHPIEFRKVELLNLKGCKDPKAKNYKSYYRAEDQGACTY